MDLVLRGAMVLLMNTSAVVFLVCISVGYCRCPIKISVWQAGMASLQFMYRAPISASSAVEMTSLMIYVTVRTAPFLGGSVELFKRKK